MSELHNHKHLLPFRRQLRKNLTPAEAELWKHLKGKKLLGRKFRRQQSIGNFIVDFYCAEEQLIIELDGDGHFNHGQQFADAERDNQLTALGFTILRFENEKVFKALEPVLEEIVRHFKTPDNLE